jgi:hypothetical protein
MIKSLELALDMHRRRGTTEVFVSEGVFLRVLEERRRQGDEGRVTLNGHYISPRFRFIHEAHWCGLRFIHVSNVALPCEG